jgi:Domain of Unknown Function (DUF1080)
MRRLAFAFLGLVIVSARARGEEDLRLFDGKTLDGWVAEGVSSASKDGKTTPVWTVADGMLHCAGSGFGFLRYNKKEFADFTFHVEFKMAPKCNSGLGVRTQAFDPKQSRATRPSIYSYEIQLIDDAGKAPDVHSSGSLYRYVAPSESALKPAGEWNTIEVTCIGPKIKVVLNDKTVVDTDQSKIEAIKNKPTKGYVCLQNHGGTIAFREVRVRDLGPKAQ